MLAGVLLAVAIASASPAANAYATPGRRIGVDGHRLNIVCMGSGRPVVVLDAGLGDWSPSWIPIQQKLASSTTVCAYDRAGYGFSDPATSARTSSTNARELHDLLRSAHLPAPYVLVGHSFGGLDVLAFVQTYRRDAAGLVLVDATAPGLPMPAALKPLMDDQLEAAEKCAPAARAGRLARASPTFTSCLGVVWGIGSQPNNGVTPRLVAAVEAQARRPAPYDAVASEMRNLTASQREVQAGQRSFGDLPLEVLTATTHGENQMPPALRASLQRFESEWRTAHLRLAALSTRGRYVLVQSGHYIQFDRPDVVIGAVHEVLSEVRSARP
ncbi:MAG TPA: alpha/beta hydrolase [Candidatus Acidoferrales bacterium]|nr:alpha/beta hydrolase [Candidatus Acidoferrales bacterium]